MRPHFLPSQLVNLTILIVALLVWPSQAALSDNREESKPSTLLADDTDTPYPEDATLDESLMFLDSLRRARLLENGTLVQFHPTQMDTQLLPDTPLSASVKKQIAEAGLNIGVEVLYFMPDFTLPPAYHSSPQAERQLILYNILRSISTLQGLTYYSASRDKWRLLFEESWVIADPSNPRKALPDPIVDDVIPLDTILIHQKDKSFGNNQSKVTYRVVGRDMSIAIVNLSPMRYKGLIRVVNPDNMQMRIIVIPDQEGLLIYGAMAAKTLNVKSFLKRAEASFTNRIIALIEWYLSRIRDEFQD